MFVSEWRLFVLIVFVYNYNLKLLSSISCPHWWFSCGSRRLSTIVVYISYDPLKIVWSHYVELDATLLNHVYSFENGRGWVNLNYAGGDSCYHHGQIPDIFAHRCIWKCSPPPLFHQVNFWNQDQMLPEFFSRTEFNLNIPPVEWLFWTVNPIFVILFPHTETVCDGKFKSSLGF